MNAHLALRDRKYKNDREISAFDPEFVTDIIRTIK
jgi:hypothetical protein